MRYYYAELNGSNIVKCILDTDRELVSASMIQISSPDSSLFGKRHIGAGIFEDVE
jgi:hypothetical protein